LRRGKELDSEVIEERVAFQAQVRDLVWRETKRRMSFLGFSEQKGLPPRTRCPHLRSRQGGAPDVSGGRHGSRQRCAGLAADAATHAGRAGASYADLGEASGITRQGAHKRWPEAVGTHWALYLLTSKSRPHGMAVHVLRSSGKAIATGRTAVGEGAALGCSIPQADRTLVTTGRAR
jgi:hypothetical protein